MSGSRRLLLLLAIVLVLLIALGGFFLYLSAPEDGGSRDDQGGPSGLIHVRSIYTYDDNPVIKPVGMGSTPEGDFWVAMRDASTIVQFDRDGDTLGYWGENGLEVGQMMTPMGVDADPLAGQVYVADRARLQLICYDFAGTLQWEIPILDPQSIVVSEDGIVAIGTFGPIVLVDGQGQIVDELGDRGDIVGFFDFPRSLDFGDDDEIYVADTNNNRVQRIQPTGEITATVDWVAGTPAVAQDDPGTQFATPSGIARDGLGNVYVLDGFRGKIEVLDEETGETVHVFEGLDNEPGTADGQFNLPTDIVHLGDDYFAVSDTFNDRIQIVRLLTPDRDNIIARNPWVWWLLPLLLLPLLAFFGRKRHFITRESMERAVDEGNARLLIGALKNPKVLDTVYTDFADVEEEGVRLGDHLESITDSSDDETPAGDEEQALAGLAARSLGQRILLARHKVVCADEAQCTRFEERKANPVAYERLREEYTIAE